MYRPLAVQTLDSAIHRLSIGETNCIIQWIAVYPVDCVIIHLLNNWAQMLLSKKLQEDGRPLKSHHSSGPFKPSTLPRGCIEQNRGT